MLSSFASRFARIPQFYVVQPPQIIANRIMDSTIVL